MGLACQRDIHQRVLAAVAEWVPVMELEPTGGSAASTLLVDETATAAVALVHRPPDRGRDVA
jgi:hypothetical protein